ncbi:unnamed protein product [Coregonus sp. 'balchen']|nr:unnamed protein product [Coregonus sp. 'balchen']
MANHCQQFDMVTHGVGAGFLKIAAHILQTAINPEKKISQTPLWPGGSVAAVSALHSRLAGSLQGSLPEGSPPSLENGVGGMLPDDLVDVPVLDPTNQPWRYVTRRRNRKQCPLATGASLEMLSQDRTQIRNSFGAFFPGDFRFQIGSGGTCTFVLCSVSLSDGFYLGFRSSELPPSTDRETV